MSDISALFPPDRLDQAAAAATVAGVDALLLTPGPDLRYLTGYDAMPLERLTCLVVSASGGGRAPFLVVPRLELAAAQASPAGRLDLEIIPWQETEDPYRLIARRLGDADDLGTIGVSDRMQAMMLLRFRDVLPGPRVLLASAVLRGPRMRKSAAEV